MQPTRNEVLQVIVGCFSFAGKLRLLRAVFVIVTTASAVTVELGMGFGLTSAALPALVDPHLVPAPILIMRGVM